MRQDLKQKAKERNAVSSLWQQAHDAFQLLISFVDPWTDLAVAYEMWQASERDPEALWYAQASVVLLCLSSVCGALAFVSAHRSDPDWKLSHGASKNQGLELLKRVTLLTPVAFALPIVSYFRFKKLRRMAIEQDEERARKSQSENHISFTSAALSEFRPQKEELVWEEAQIELSKMKLSPAMRELLGAEGNFGKQAKNKKGGEDDDNDAEEIYATLADSSSIAGSAVGTGAFIVATVTSLAGALPASALQLAYCATRSKGELSTIAAISLFLSLLQLAAKSLRFCSAHSKSVVIFMTTLFARDVFHAAASSTLVPVLMEQASSSWWWVFLKYSKVLCWTIIFGAFLSLIGADLRRPHNKGKMFEQITIAVLVIVLGTIPGLVVFEVCMTCWYVFVLSSAAMAFGHVEALPRLCIIDRFLWSRHDDDRNTGKLAGFIGNTSVDWSRALQLLIDPEVRCFLAVKSAKQKQRFTQQDWATFEMYKRLVAAARSGDNNNCNDNIDNGEVKEQEENNKNSDSPFLDRVAFLSNSAMLMKQCRLFGTNMHMEKEAASTQARELNIRLGKEREFVAEPWTWSRFKKMFVASRTLKELFGPLMPHEPEHEHFFILAFGLAVAAVNCVLSLILPVAAVLFEIGVSNLNTVQKLTVCVAAVLSVIALVLLPSAIRFHLTALVAHGLRKDPVTHLEQHAYYNHLEQLIAIVDSFYSVALTSKVFAVSDAVVPSECLDKHVLRFVDGRDIDGCVGLSSNNVRSLA